MKKKFLIFALLALSMTASFAFGACDKTPTVENSTPTGDVSGDASDSSSDDPVVEYTAVTYVFVGEDGENLTYHQTVETGSALSYTLPNVVYTDTWYADSACTQAVTVAESESMTVYTPFADIYVDYVLRSGGKTVAMDSVILRDYEIVLPEPNSIEGHTFQGWALGENTYQAGEKLVFDVIPEDHFVQVEAVWTANSYSVRYLSEDREPQTLTQTFGDKTLAPIERTGHTFLGWYEEGNDTPVTTITKEVELTAKWEAFSYALAFDLGGYEGVHDFTDGEYSYGDNVALPSLERTGYSFVGWFVSVDGAEGVKTDANAYMVGTNLEAKQVSFAAKFEAKERTVTVYLDKGAREEITLKTGENLSTALQSLIGERFAGWFYDEENLRGVGVSDKMPAIGDEESFCIYGAYDKTYAITFTVDGVSETKVLLFGEEIVDAPEKVGHNFLGWFTAQEGGEKLTHVPAGDQTLYAQFELKTLGVTFDLKGGNGTVADFEEKYGNEVTLPTGEGLSKQYYNFGGWTDGEKTYAAGETLTLTDNLALSAVWNSYDVQLHLTDWDGTVIVSGTFKSGMGFDLPGGSVWEDIDEFEGFYYEDIYGNEYYLREGDILSEDVTATAFYVNRRTNEKLVFPAPENFVFYERNSDAYWISGRERTWSEERGLYEYNQYFKGEGFPKSYFCLPATYNGKYVYGIPDADRMSVGGFSIYAASNFQYDATPYQITGHLYIPSCYVELGDYAFYSQQAAIVEFGRNSKMKRFGERADVLMNVTAVYGFPQNLVQVENYAMGVSNNSYALYYQDGSEITAFPTSIRYLGVDAFQHIDIFTEVDLSNVLSCQGNAFAYCTKIESVNFGNISAVPSGIFSYCTSLKEVFIPASVEAIRDSAFRGSGLEAITFEEGSNLKSIGFIAFYETPLREIVIPDSVTTIGTSAFEGMDEDDTTSISVLEKVVLPKSLKTVGDFAFGGVPAEFVLPEGLETVGEGAFYGTQNWKKVVLPESLKSIGEKAFMKVGGYTYEEDDLYVLKIGPNLETIPLAAFRQIKNVCGIEFSEGGKLKAIDNYAFADMPELDGATINFPEGITDLDGRLFCYMKDGIYNIPLDEAAGIKAVTLPSTLTWLGGYSFAYCTKLESVTFADNQNPHGGVDENGNGVVENLEKTNALIVGNGAFAHCTALTEIELPCHLYRLAGGVSGTPNGVFWGCSNLATVIFRGRDSGEDDLLELSTVTFEGCTGLKTIKIDRNSEAAMFISWGDYGKSVFMKDCSGVMLWVRSAYQGYYNDKTNVWGECQPTRIKRVRILT